MSAESRRESTATVEDSKNSCLGIDTQAMEITLKSYPLKVVNIPWRNNNLSTLHTDPPLSEQGETIIGVYLLVLGKYVGQLFQCYTLLIINTFINHY